MNMGVVFRLFVCLSILCGFAIPASAQDDATSESKILRIQYNGVYQLQDSYTILYDNAVETAKLKAFHITFYGPGRETLAKTETQTYPPSGQIVTYDLEQAVSGFNEAELTILSLHSGELNAFPSNIGSILALNELTEVPIHSPPKPTPPKLTTQDRQRLADIMSNMSQILSALDEKSDAISSANTAHENYSETLEMLAAKTGALLDNSELEDQNTQIDDLKSQIRTLETNAETKATSLSQNSLKLTALQDEADSLQADIQTLQQESQTVGVQAQAIVSSLENIEAQLDALQEKIAEISVPTANELSELSALEATFLDFKTQLETPLLKTSDASIPDQENPEPPTEMDWRVVLAAIAAGLAVIFLVAKFLFAPNAKARPSKSILARTEAPSVIFPASPMLAGNVAAPLAPAGQLAAAQLQMLSGPYAVLKDAYLATGRIGYAQEGIPSAEDYAFGTGFLVSDRHVVTNRHVHGLYGHYLLDKSDPGGIEFIAEKGKDSSDFVPFNGEPPLLLPALDIAIYTLSHAVTNRVPVSLKSIETDTLLAKDIVVIGYPDTHTPDKAEVLAVVEDDPVFAVKRISQGQIFRHSTDRDDPLGVETAVNESKNSDFIMPAICHNASTMGGNSGSPLLDLKNGRLVGVHFKGFKVFNQEESANLAMAIAQLTQSEQLTNLSNVTTITTRTDIIS